MVIDPLVLNTRYLGITITATSFFEVTLPVPPRPADGRQSGRGSWHIRGPARSISRRCQNTSKARCPAPGGRARDRGRPGGNHRGRGLSVSPFHSAYRSSRRIRQSRVASCSIHATGNAPSTPKASTPAPAARPGVGSGNLCSLPLRRQYREGKWRFPSVRTSRPSSSCCQPGSPGASSTGLGEQLRFSGRHHSSVKKLHPIPLAAIGPAVKPGELSRYHRRGALHGNKSAITIYGTNGIIARRLPPIDVLLDRSNRACGNLLPYAIDTLLNVACFHVAHISIARFSHFFIPQKL